MSRVYSPQVSQDGSNGKHSQATPASDAVLGEFDRLRERHVPSGNLDSGDRSDASSERQVSAMEKDLRDDAPWKRIQRNTFTRWVNEHLKNANESISSLQTDLSDGLKLIALIEVLSGKRFAKFNKRPTFRSQKLENVSLALNFLQEDEGIKLVSIDSTDIVDGRLKLILGLIWALILHYSISLLKWDDEEQDMEKEKMTPKERLMSWFANKIPLTIKNFTTDWNDGRACGALDNAVAPGLCPDWESWDPKDALRNATEAMNLAEKWLGVSQLIRPEDMIDPQMDEQSMMTYLAQFPVAKPKPGTPSFAKSIGDPKLVRCTGRGLQSTGIRIETVYFRVCTKMAGEGLLSISIFDSESHSVSFTTREVSRGLHEYSYTPTKPVRHVIEILFGGRHVIGSPFVVDVGLPWNSNIFAFGPGLTGGAVGYSAEFNVDMMGESGMLGFSIAGPSQLKIDCKDGGDYLASVKYWPTSVGEYAVHILCGDQDIPGSPFMSEISALPTGVDPSKVTFEFVHPKRGSGISGDALEEVILSVDARQAGGSLAPLEVSVVDGEYRDVVVTEKEASSGVHTFTFTPEDSSRHFIHITYAGVAVPGSPAQIPIPEPITEKAFDKVDATPRFSERTPTDVSSVAVDGLDTKVFINRMLEFTVDARNVAGTLDGTLRVVLTSPSGIVTEALVSRKSAGFYSVTYSVFEEGVHVVDILYEGIRVPGSPYSQLAMRTTPPPPASPSVKSNGSQVIETSTEVTEDGATIVTRRETRVTSQVVTSSQIVYTEELDETDVITGDSLGGVAGQDVRSLAGPRCDVTKIVATGIGLEKAFCNKPNTFTVKADAAGYNMLLVGIYGKILHAHEVQVKHIGHAHYQVVYELKERGQYLLSVKYGEVHIPGSPFVINCV